MLDLASRGPTLTKDSCLQLAVTRSLFDRASQNPDQTVGVYQGSMTTARDIYLAMDASRLEAADRESIYGLLSFGVGQFEEMAYFVHLKVSENQLVDRTAVGSEASWEDVYR